MGITKLLGQIGNISGKVANVTGQISTVAQGVQTIASAFSPAQSKTDGFDARPRAPLTAAPQWAGVALSPQQLSAPLVAIERMTGKPAPDPNNFGNLTDPFNAAQYQKAVVEYLGATKQAVQGSASLPGGNTTKGGPGGPFGWSGPPPDAKDYGDQSQPQNQNDFNGAMFKYQQALGRMNEFWQMLSNIEKSGAETRKALIGNLR